MGVFGAHTDSTDSTRIFARIQEKKIREIRGIRGVQSATNEHKLSRIIFPCSDSCALSMDFWVERAWV